MSQPYDVELPFPRPLEVGDPVRVLWGRQPVLGYVYQLDPENDRVKVTVRSHSFRKWYPTAEVEKAV